MSGFLFFFDVFVIFWEIDYTVPSHPGVIYILTCNNVLVKLTAVHELIGYLLRSQHLVMQTAHICTK